MFLMLQSHRLIQSNHVFLKELNDFRVGTVRSVVFKVVRVDIPAEFIFLTVISGVPVNPCELVAIVAVFAKLHLVQFQ